ncbi:hypothetical protein OEB94_08110 [Streptomyces sp. ICN988]|uniref:hypothetical protein n=1 Tax=Streptomyces sp. ICN988 TaxID=2983765 RepID=UPI0021E45269|nr:hypothetical protein [Streptomyces sp. ICN988]MCV2459236.1 hypothetical protein [Streptomyces sp. ICN988]
MDAGDEGTGDAMSQPHPVTFGPGTAGRAEPAEPLRAAAPTPVAGVGTVPGGCRLRLVADFAVRGDEAAGKPAAPASGRS